MIRILKGILPEKKAARLSILLSIFSLILLFFYSFTQIDLSLTITKTPFLQSIQQAFQWVGYFNRPLSASLYLLLLVLLFTSYILLLRFVKQGFLTRKNIWALIIFVSFLFVISYNAFSYDLFNYIFDAKIITHYHENPYLKKALDYTGDPMLSFMHWVERVYPYGPTWLIFTVPISIIGLQYFVITFFLFKAAILACFVGTAYFLEKIAKRIHAESSALVLVFFALNPLVIIESLVSAHNDIVMLFFAIFGLWLILEKKIFFGWLSFLFSVGIKFVTGFLAPVYFYLYLRQKDGKPMHFEKAVWVMMALMFAAMILATLRTNFQPWYFLYVLPFAAFLSRKRLIVIPMIVFSFGYLLQYVPYLYLGNYDPPVPRILWSLFLITSIISLVLMAALAVKKPRT